MSELSQEARALIDSVSKLDDPSPEDRARVKQRVALSLGAAAFTAVAVTQVSGGASSGLFGSLKAGLWSTTGKLALCAGVVGGALALGWPSGQTTSRSAAVGRQMPGDAQLEPPARAARGEAAPALAPSSELPAEAPAASGAPAPRAAVKRSAAAKRGARADAQRDAADAQRDAADAQNTLALELALLGDAQAALRAGQPERARALARQHQERYPAGVLREERFGIETLAECALGQSGRARANTFLRAAPDSPLAARVRKACGVE